jgi:hypothetical protein
MPTLSSEKLVSALMKFQDIRVYHREDNIEVCIISKTAPQSVKMWHCCSNLRISVEKLVEDMVVTACQL